VVAGGGPFADAVRAAQQRMGFDDDAAHRMALLAMEQYAEALAGIEGSLVPAASLGAIRRILRGGGIPVWLPTRMALAAADVPRSWDVTSDSLAAWLAGQLGARRLLLVKQVELSADRVPVEKLIAGGIVDPAFARFLQASGAEAELIGPEGHEAAVAAICHGTTLGVRIGLP